MKVYCLQIIILYYHFFVELISGSIVKKPKSDMWVNFSKHYGATQLITILLKLQHGLLQFLNLWEVLYFWKEKFVCPNTILTQI